MFIYPNCRESIWLAILFILWVIVAQIIFIVVGVPSYLYSILLYGSTTVALALAFQRKIMDRSILRFNKMKTQTLLFAVGGTLCIPWVHSLFYSVIPFPEFLKKIYTAVGNKEFNENYIYLIISSILLPFIMEIIFRGIILRGLLTEYKPWKSITIAAVIYAMVWGIMTLLPLFGLLYGVWFGWLYVYSRNLWIGLLSFIALQLMSVLYAIISNSFTLPSQVNSAMSGELWIINLAITILFCALTYFLHQTFKCHEN